MSRDDPPETCPIGGERALTAGEVALVRSIFGRAIDTAKVRIRRRRWFPLQTRKVTMAPMGHLHFHPQSESYCEDFSTQKLSKQGHFIHEMTHVWQAQTKGRWYLPLWRNFSRSYEYSIIPGLELEYYGIEQQAEIVRHAFMLRNGGSVIGVADAAIYAQLVRFAGAVPLSEGRTNRAKGDAAEV